MRSRRSPLQRGKTVTTLTRRASGPSMASTISAMPSQRNIACQSARAAARSASSARPAPDAVKTCTRIARANVARIARRVMRHAQARALPIIGGHGSLEVPLELPEHGDVVILVGQCALLKLQLLLLPVAI